MKPAYKKTLIAVTCLTAAILLGWYCLGGKGATTVAASAPRENGGWISQKLDAGPSIIGRDRTFVVTLRGARHGDGGLPIPEGVIASCSCMKPRFQYVRDPKDPHIDVHFLLNAKGPEGPQSAEVTLISQSRKIASIDVAYISEATVSVSCRSVDIAHVPSQGAGGELRVRLTSNISTPFHAELAHKPSNLLITKYASSTRGAEYGLSLSGNSVPGAVADDIIWKVPKEFGGSVYLPVVGKIDSKYEIQPGTLRFPILLNNKSVKAVFDITVKEPRLTLDLRPVCDSNQMKVHLTHTKDGNIHALAEYSARNIPDGFISGTIGFMNRQNVKVLQLPYEVIHISKHA